VTYSRSLVAAASFCLEFRRTAARSRSRSPPDRRPRGAAACNQIAPPQGEGCCPRATLELSDCSHKACRLPRRSWDARGRSEAGQGHGPADGCFGLRTGRGFGSEPAKSLSRQKQQTRRCGDHRNGRRSTMPRKTCGSRQAAAGARSSARHRGSPGLKASISHGALSNPSCSPVQMSPETGKKSEINPRKPSLSHVFRLSQVDLKDRRRGRYR